MKCSTIPILPTELVRYYPDLDLGPIKEYLGTAEYTHGALRQTKNHYLHELEVLKPMFDKIQEMVKSFKIDFEDPN